MRPLTHTGPKQLIRIGGKPISQWGLEGLRDNGITDIAIILGKNNPRRVIDYYGDGSSFGVNITYIYQGNARGLAHAIGLARDFVGNDSFVVYLGDNVILDGLEKLISFRGDASILLSRVKDPNRFGVAIVSKGKVEKLVEKPKEAISDLALVGVYAFKPVIFEAIDQLVPSARGELEITEAIQSLIDWNRDVKYTEIDGWWKDTGTPSDLLDANSRLLDRFCQRSPEAENYACKIEGRVQIGKGTSIENSSISGPVYIGNNVKITDSYIGPYTSVGDGCRIENAELSNSVVFDNASIREVKTHGSIVGQSAVIDRAESKPVVSKLVIGEGALVSI